MLKVNAVPNDSAFARNQAAFCGAGLGLRRSLMDELLANADKPDAPDFLELAPENWIGIGGLQGKKLSALAEQYPLSCHGLSLSIGSSAPLDLELLRNIRQFLNRYHISYYSEHLSFCSDAGHLYDLLPIPFTEDAVTYVSNRIRQAQDVLGRKIALENPSWYSDPGHEMSEIEFIVAVVERADCDILLDVNNVFVNSINHQYDPLSFLGQLPQQCISGFHIAGHFRESETLCIDSHGTPVIAPVWSLLESAYQLLGVKPTLLERDFNIPPIEDLLAELTLIRAYQNNHCATSIHTRRAVR